MNERREPFRADAEHDPLQLQAADWVGRLSNSSLSVEETLAWQEWMRADARHAEAFHRFEQISRSLRMMEPPQAPGKWQLERDSYDGSVPLSDWQARKRSSGWRLTSRAALAAALALMVVAAAWVMLASGWISPHPSQEVMMTRVGENRVVHLTDGSTVTLGGDTRLEWTFTSRQRQLALSHGEALFEVARDASRPFKVRAGDATVTALGTAFNVRRASDHTVVAVTNGRVVVEPAAHLLPVAVLREFKPKLRPVRVDAGQQTVAGSEGIERATRIEDVGSTTSWQKGRLTFRLQPLRYVLEDVNRYSRKPIVAADEHEGSLLVSGTVIGDNVDGWVASLEHAFGLTAVEEDGRIVLRAP